jgi:hypothetical protein
LNRAIACSNRYEGEREEIISILRNAWEREAKPEMGGRFGCVFHPGLKYAPEIAPFYAKPEAITVMRTVVADVVRMAHSGVLLIDETRDFCAWHCHLNGDTSNQWESKPKGHRGQVDRVLCNIYLHGSNEDVGQLLVFPRKTTDAWVQPSDDFETEWQGQHILEFPPGSAVIFDTALWHAARQPTKSCTRYLFGGHYQRRQNLTPHREDNRHDGPEIEKYRAEIPMFASLVSARATSG